MGVISTTRPRWVSCPLAVGWVVGWEKRGEMSVMVMREAYRPVVCRDYVLQVVQSSLPLVGVLVLVVSVVCEGVWFSSIQAVEAVVGPSPGLW